MTPFATTRRPHDPTAVAPDGADVRVLLTMLDATATCDAGGTRLTLAVVNRDRDRAHRASVELGEAAVKDDVLVAEVNGASVDATNSFETPRAVDVRETRLTARGHRFEHEFPAHSISVLRVPLG